MWHHIEKKVLVWISEVKEENSKMIKRTQITPDILKITKVIPILYIDSIISEEISTKITTLRTPACKNEIYLSKQG